MPDGRSWIAAFDGIRHLVPGLDGVGAGGTDLDVNLYLVNECFDGESFSISSYDTSAEIGKTAKQTLIASDDLQPIPHLVQAALYDVALDDNLPPEEAAANLHGRVSRQVDLVRRSFYVRTALDAVNQLPGHPSAIFGKGLMADAHVMDEAGAEAHLAALPSLAVLAIELPEIVRTAVQYHDAGKAHPAFQEMLRDALPEDESTPDADIQMAKSPGSGKMDAARRHFRHELGSALVVLAHVDGPGGERGRDLAAYLAASHHGKVRLAIRSLPGQRRGFTDSNPDPDMLLGYRLSSQETIPAVELGEGLRVGETKLDLSLARIGLSHNGKRSWLERSLGLLEWLGPFRLAYLEAILRAADMRASMKEQGVLE